MKCLCAVLVLKDGTIFFERGEYAMEKDRFQFCLELKKNVLFVDEFEILTNGNGRDKVIGEGICNHDCSLKAICEFAKVRINHFL